MMVQPSKPSSDFSILRSLFKEMGLPLTFFVIPALMSFLCAFFEALSLGLLIPVAKGALSGNLSFIFENRLGHFVEPWIPSSIKNSFQILCFIFEYKDEFSTILSFTTKA